MLNMSTHNMLILNSNQHFFKDKNIENYYTGISSLRGIRKYKTRIFVYQSI